MSLRELLNPGCLPIGIDIGASGVKMLQLRRRGRDMAVVAAARVDLPAAENDADQPQRTAALVSLMRRRLDSGGFVGGRCVVSLDDRLLRIRSTRQPRMPDDEMERAIRLDAPGRLGFAEGEGAEIGWIRAGEVRQGEDIREEVILVGVRRGPVEDLVARLAAAGFRPIAIEPGFVGCARSFGRTQRRASDEQLVKIVVDVGLRSTGVMLVRGRGAAFYKPLEIGGEAMTRASAERLGLEPATVADLRRQRKHDAAAGKPPSDPRVDRAMFEAVRPLIGDLAREVALCLRYYGVTFRGTRPEACFVVGGEAHEPRLAELLGLELHLPTSVGRPLERVGIERGRGLGEDTPGFHAEWSVAAGLGLRLWEQRSAPRSREHRGEDLRATPSRAIVAEARRAA